jgi:predicted RNA-binding Zn-ribbon protein involved in translation (DUF1610 family)
MLAAQKLCVHAPAAAVASVLISPACVYPQLLATSRQQQAQALQLLQQEGDLVTVRLYNYEASNLHIRQLKSNNIGRLQPQGTDAIWNHTSVAEECAPTTVTSVAATVCMLLAWPSSGVNAILCTKLRGIDSRLSSHRAHHTFLCPVSGKLATVRGTVVRMSHIRPLITELHFTCNRCGAVIPRTFPEGRFSQPTSCPSRF